MTDSGTATGRRATAPDAPSDTEPSGEPPDDGRVAAAWWWLGHVVVVAEIAFATRNFTFFQDDFVFLGQARGGGVVAGIVQAQPFTLDYLRLGLFEHFSPMTRALFWGLGRSEEPMLAARILVLLLIAGVVLSWGFLNRVILGRTWPALLVTMTASQGLVLARLAGWTTAALNILPALALCALSLATAMLYLRHRRSGWFGVASVVFLALAVLDYELAMLLPMFTGLWFLWCAAEPGRRVTSRIMRTLSYWTALAAVSGAAAWNFLTNYRLPGLPHATGPQVLETVWFSLSQGLFPAFLGVFSPAPDGASPFAIVTAAAWLAAIAWSVRRSGARAVGPIALGVSGWLVCTLILGYSRAAINGPVVGVDLFYAAVPLLVLMVSVSESLRMAARVSCGEASNSVETTHRDLGRRPVMVLTAMTLVSAVLTQVHAVAVTDPGGLASASARAGENFRQDLRELGPGTQVVSTPVDPSVVLPNFWPYNVLSRSVGLGEEDVRWDWFGAGQLHRADGNGQILPVDVVPLGRAGKAGITTVNSAPSRNGRCHTTRAADSQITITLPEPISGDNLTILVKGTLSRATALSPYVVTEGTLQPATGAVTSWPEGDLRAVLFPAAPSVAALQLVGMKIGTTMCVNSVVVGQLVDVP